MADGLAPMDQGTLAFSRGLGGGSSGGGGPDDGRNTEDDANSKDMLEWAASGAGRGVAVAHKLVLGPIGINLSKAGKISLSWVAGGDTEGFTGKNIMPTGGGIMPDTPGGLLYQIARAIFRNRELTNQTAGVGGNPLIADSGAGGGAAASGDVGSGGGETTLASLAASSGIAELFIQAGTNSFDFEPVDVSRSVLGMLSPPTFGDAGLGRGTGFGLAA